MANSKISGLAAVTTVGDTDEYVVAVGGATKKITGANVKAAVAPKAGTYITQVAESGLSAEQALAALGTGILKNTTTTGVLSIAAGSDLPTAIPIAKLADPTTGKVIGSAGSAAAAVFPPGYEFDYVQITTSATSTATTDATATAVLTGNAVVYDGSTVIEIQIYAQAWSNSDLGTIFMNLYDGSTDLGRIGSFTAGGAGYAAVLNLRARLTPTAASHTYSARFQVASGTGTITAGAGGTATARPGVDTTGEGFLNHEPETV